MYSLHYIGEVVQKGADRSADRIGLSDGLLQKLMGVTRSMGVMVCKRGFCV